MPENKAFIFAVLEAEWGPLFGNPCRGAVGRLALTRLQVSWRLRLHVITEMCIARR